MLRLGNIKGFGTRISNQLLYNKYVLYFFFIVVLIQLVILLGQAKWMAAAVLVLAGFLTTFFSKNMVVVLCVALIASVIFIHGLQALVRHEAFTEGAKNKKKKSHDGDAADTEEDDGTADE